MKILKNTLLFIFTAGILLVPIKVAYAAQVLSGFCGTSGASATTVCQDSNAQSSSQTNPVITAIKEVINVVSYAIGIIAVFVIIISGLRFVMSNGNSNTISQVRSSIFYAVIGIFVAALAQVFVVFVLSKLK